MVQVMLPGWMTIHVIGYGLAAVAITGVGVTALHEHDAKVRAEVTAIEHARADSIVAKQNIAAVVGQSAHVETVTVALRSVIQPTKVLIDSATKFIHDTVLVAKALDSAKATVAACQLVATACDQFRKMATDSLKSLADLFKVRDHERLIATTPLNPRFSRGLQLGVGACGVGRRVADKTSVFGTPCASVTYGLHLRIF